MHSRGDGIPKDYKEAVKWFRLGAKKGHISSLVNLGKSYWFGQGVRRDAIYSHMWLDIGAKSGDKDAIKARDIIAKTMTPAQFTNAKKLARDCIHKKYMGCEDQNTLF